MTETVIMTLPTGLRKYLWRHIPRKKAALGRSIYKMPVLSPNEIALSDNHENWLDDVYASALACKKGGFVDVGANTGQTLMKLLSIDPDRHYIGFEPQVAPAFAVEQFIMENNLPHFKVLPIGLSNRNGIVELSTRGTGYEASFSPVASIVPDFRPRAFYTYSKYVFVALGDDILEDLKIDDISMIKIDVEGAELEVIEGLSTTLKRHDPFILFEVLHDYVVASGEGLSDEMISFRTQRTARLESKIRSIGYSIYHINGTSSLDKVEQISPKNISELSTTNYIAVPLRCEVEFLALIARSRAISIADT